MFQNKILSEIFVDVSEPALKKLIVLIYIDPLPPRPALKLLFLI